MARKYLNIQTVICVICLLFTAVSVLVFSFATTYTVPLGDDLFTPHTEYASLFSLIGASASFAAETYVSWQGTFFSFFLSYLLHPFHGHGVLGAGGNLMKLKIVMFLNAFLFFAALLYLLFSLIRLIAPKRYRLAAYVSAAVLFTFLNIQSYAEVFFWFTPTVVYSIPVTVMLLALSCFIRMRKGGQKRTLWTALAAVSAFCASGGVLMVAGALCYILLAVSVYDRITEKKWHLPSLIVFGAAFAGALINTLAPGNFIRSDNAGAAIRPLSAALSSLQVLYLELEHLFTDTPLLAGLIVLFLLGIFFCEGTDAARLKQQIVFTCMLLPALFVALFPLQLGNGGAGIAVRGQFVVDVIALPLLCALFFFGGQFFALHLAPEKRAVHTLPVWLLLICVLSLNRVTLFSLPQYGMLRNLANGSYRAYYLQIHQLFEDIRNSEEEDIVVTLPEDLEQYQNFLLSTDPSYYINHGLAVQAGKQTIRASAP